MKEKKRKNDACLTRRRSIYLSIYVSSARKHAYDVHYCTTSHDHVLYVHTVRGAVTYTTEGGRREDEKMKISIQFNYHPSTCLHCLRMQYSLFDTDAMADE